jgi:L-alanine-DL-glutamate epimerase-like enolase superfamily enzyme
VGAGIARDAERFAVRELIHHELGPFLLGKDPMETEKIWNDACWDIGMSYKVRTGVVDQALWDIKGHYLNQPIYRLLGGTSPLSVSSYTTFGFNVYTLEELVALARQLGQHGYDKPKMPHSIAFSGSPLDCRC